MSRIFRRSFSSTKRASSAIPDGSAQFATHLNELFPRLTFPPELAQRIFTHGSHKSAIHGHNGRLSFIGRRVLESYFLLFLHSVARTQHQHNYEVISSRALNSYLLGEHIAPRWSLCRTLRWTPTVSQNVLQQQSNSDPLTTNAGVVRSVGLYKVMGETVQAVIGGVYHQHGGSVAHRMFHTRVLPHILLPGTAGGVPSEFHHKALSLCERMGGMDGHLLLEDSTSEVVGAVEPSSVPGGSLLGRVQRAVDD